MNRTTSGRMAALCAAVALAAGLAAGAGVFARGDGSTVLATSARGEVYPMVTTGVYAYNAERVVAEGIGWDLFTLFIAVPAMLLCVPFVARGLLRARLFALGLLGYFFYQYLMYAMTWAIGPLFLPFIGIFAASLAGIAWVASSLPRQGLAAYFAPGFPRRSMAVLCGVLSLVLVGMWLGRIAAVQKGDLAGGLLLGQTTLVVQALDLGLVVPLALFTAVMAWKGRTVGYVLSSVFVVKSAAMALAICAMLLAAWRVQGTLEVAPLALFGGAALVSLALGRKMYRSVKEQPCASAAGRSGPPPAVEGFLRQRRIAVVGVSRQRGFGNLALQELRGHGYDVVPVNAEADVIQGEPCFRSLTAVVPPVDAVLAVVPPARAKGVVEECVRLGIRHLWLQQGAESPEAIQLAEAHGIAVAHHACVLMYAQPRSYHRFHRWLHDTFSRRPVAVP